MEDKDVIKVITEHQKETNEVIKEYQRSIRATIIVAFIIVAIIYVATSFSMAYQTKQITKAAETIVDTYFNSSYDYGTIEQSIEIGD